MMVRHALLVLTCSTTAAMAQPPLMAWERFFDGSLPGMDEAHALAVAPDNSVYVTGTSANLAPQNTCTTLRYGADGSLFFADHVYGAGQDATNIGRDVAVGADGHVYVCGTTSHNNGDLALVKYSANGRVWRKNYEQFPSADVLEEALGLALDATGNIYLAGYITSTAGMGLDNYTMKIDSTGEVVWADAFALSSADERATCAAVAANGNVYVGGEWWDLDGTGGIDMSVVRFEPGGARDWDEAYTAPLSADRVNDITPLMNGGVAICGASRGASSLDMTMIAYDANGTLTGSTTFTSNNNADDEAVAVRQLENSNLVMTGSTVQSLNGNDVRVITTDVTDLSNNSVWNQHYAGEAGLGAWPTAMTSDSDNNIYIVGYMLSADGQTTDGVVLKYDSGGMLQWAIPYNGPDGNDDRLNDIGLNGAGDILVCGTTHSTASASRYVTVQYGNAVGLNEPHDRALIRLAPVPARNTVSVTGIMPGERWVLLNAAGATVLTGASSSTIDVANFTEGMYVLRVLSEHRAVSARLVVQHDR